MVKSLLQCVQQELEKLGIIFPDFTLEELDKQELIYSSVYKLSDEEEIYLGIHIKIPERISPDLRIGRLAYTESLGFGTSCDQYVKFKRIKKHELMIESMDVNDSEMELLFRNRTLEIEEVVQGLVNYVRNRGLQKN
jgi:hypothetical protein